MTKPDALERKDEIAKAAVLSCQETGLTEGTSNFLKVEHGFIIGAEWADENPISGKFWRDLAKRYEGQLIKLQANPPQSQPEKSPILSSLDSQVVGITQSQSDADEISVKVCAEGIRTIVEEWMSDPDASFDCRHDEDCDHCVLLMYTHSIEAASARSEAKLSSLISEKYRLRGEIVELKAKLEARK